MSRLHMFLQEFTKLGFKRLKRMWVAQSRKCGTNERSHMADPYSVATYCKLDVFTVPRTENFDGINRMDRIVGGKRLFCPHFLARSASLYPINPVNPVKKIFVSFGVSSVLSSL